MSRKNNPDKLLDMIRGILPSTARNYARLAKASIKREVRRGVRTALRTVDPETTKRDLLRDAYLTDVVRDRRGADKLNHFMRWCHAITKGMTAEEALAHVRSLLPRNLIGDHAYGHWETERRPDRHRYVYVPYERQQQSTYESTRVRLRRALAEDPTLLGALNRLIKSRLMFDETRRLLRGVHDIDAFVHDLVYRGGGVELRCVREMIEHVEKGGLAAALAVCASSGATTKCNRLQKCDGVTFLTNPRRARTYVTGMITTNSDETMIVRDEEELEIGEQTLVQLSARVVEMHSRTTIPQHRPVKNIDYEAIDRLERKLDMALRQITALTQRLESMDMTLARVVGR